MPNKARILIKALRHDPESLFTRPLDKNGFIHIEHVLKQLDITFQELMGYVENDTKGRFEVNRDKIRAAQGHSINVDLALEAKQPPEFLYHGTTSRLEHVIGKEGLKKMSRDHVHLTEDFHTATKVGMRHVKRGEMVLEIVVHAQAMHEAGHKFYQASNGVWLTNNVPPNFIDILE